MVVEDCRVLFGGGGGGERWGWCGMRESTETFFGKRIEKSHFLLVLELNLGIKLENPSCIPSL